MTFCPKSTLVIALGIADDPLRHEIRRRLEKAGCRVESCVTRTALLNRVSGGAAELALVIGESSWLRDPALRGRCHSDGPPVLAVGREIDAPRPALPIATATIHIAGGEAGARRIAYLARHLIEQDRRWRGSWISTGLVQMPRFGEPRSSEERDRPSQRPPD